MRGRRPELLVDTTELDGPVVDLGSRTAWLLRVTRLAHDDPNLRRLRGFAQRLAEAGFAADHTTVSHWENATRPVPQWAFAGYERVLGLPAGLLRGAVDGFRAALPSSSPAPAPTPAPHPQRQLDAVFERVRSGQVSGGDWILLADVFTGPQPVLVPTVVLEELVATLLNEFQRSVGGAYTTRFETLRRLVADGHLPSAIVLEAVDAAVAEPGAQVVYEPLSLRGETNHRDNIHRLLALLADPARPVRTGAAHAIANLLITRTFPGSHAPGLESRIRDLMVAGSGDAELAMMLLPRLPGRSAARVRGGLDRTDWDRPRPPATPRPVTTDQRRVVGALCAAAVESFPWPEDDMLARLVYESLFSQRLELRHHAALLLASTPYASRLGDAVIDEVERTQDAVVEAAMNRLLTYVVDRSHATRLKNWLSCPANPRAGTALRALAHSGTHFADVDLRPFLTAGARVGPAALYAAGMSAHPVLDQLAQTPAHGSEAGATSAAAAWWLRTGGAVHDLPA